MSISERFKYYFPSQIIKDKKTEQRYYGNKPLADLLNALHEENEMLKERLVDKDRLLYNELIVQENLLKRIKELEE